MAPTQTTCCCSLRTGATVVASVFIVASWLIGILCIIDLVNSLGFVEGNNFWLAVHIILLVFCVLYVALGVLLLVAANKGDYSKAKIWLICTGILFVIRVVVLILTMFSPLGAVYLIGILIELCALIFHVYAFWVVVRFMQELKRAGTEAEGGVDEHTRLGPA